MFSAMHLRSNYANFPAPGFLQPPTPYRSGCIWVFTAVLRDALQLLTGNFEGFYGAINLLRHAWFSCSAHPLYLAPPSWLPFYSRLMEILFLLLVIQTLFFFSLDDCRLLSPPPVIVLILLAANCLYTTLLFLFVPSSPFPEYYIASTTRKQLRSNKNTINLPLLSVLIPNHWSLTTYVREKGSHDIILRDDVLTS